MHPHSFAVAVATAGAVEAQLRAEMHECDRGCAPATSDRVSRAATRARCVTPSGRVLAAAPAGLAGPDGSTLPPGGGELTLPSGEAAFAEPRRRRRRVPRPRARPARGPRAGRVLRLHLLGRDRAGVDASGRAVPLRRRHSEILALLCAAAATG